ncbi:MAG: hypothetical protein U1E78_03240 [Gammaproteobacteria bacterium]
MTIQNFITIDEVGLLPGATEPTEINGVLDLDYSKTYQSIQFSELVSQTLPELDLKSDGVPLYYTFANNQHDIIARRGANGDMVFKASVTDEGHFQFTLFQPLDREYPENLLSDQTVKYKVKNDFGDHQEIGFTYQLPTEASHPYQLSFYYSPASTGNSPVDIYWSNQHLYTISESIEGWTGFNFPIISGVLETSELKFVTKGELSLETLLHDITILDSAQSQLPIPFQFLSDGKVGTFIVNVTTDVPIIATNDPFTIVYEQSVYQNIIVETNKGSSSFTKINLDSLFDSMHISPENRKVEVTHRPDSDHYTVHISDATESVQNPITVADIKLSVEGEDHGLDTFFKYVQFDV